MHVFVKLLQNNFIIKNRSIPKDTPMVREAGVEPARPCEHWHLKPASLPIPPLAQVVELRCFSATWLYYHTAARMSTFFCWFFRTEKVKQKMPCFFNKLFCVILCILGSTKRPPAKVPPVAYALSCYFRVIFVCYACVFLLNMNEREQHALRRHPLGQRRVRTAPA